MNASAIDSADAPSRVMPRHLAGQGALLFCGFTAAQALSFVRNALIGHALSKDNFGIAATITIILQMIETLSDLGADRLIVQARDGDQPKFQGVAHSLLVARGLLLAAILFLAGPYLAIFFNAGHAASAFQLAALVPLLKGFQHLDYRTAQRHFDNRPQMLIEVLPQAIALLLTIPLLSITHDFNAVVTLAVGQALVGLLLSHAIAKRSYRLDFDAEIFKRQLAFGLPILASSVPLIAVYQGDRLIIGHLSGMEALANFTAAFMITMVPGLIAAKVGHALMLPLFSETVRDRQPLLPRFRLAAESTAVLAAIYVSGFIVCGGAVLPLVFGQHYSNLGVLTSWLAAMWALRMIQAVPGMALMAHGQTAPFFWAGMIRAAALPCILYAALRGAPLTTLAAIGFAFEALSVAYIAWRLEKLEPKLGQTLLTRAAYLTPVAGVSLLASTLTTGSTVSALLTASVVVAAVGIAGLALMPTLKAIARRALNSRRGVAIA